MVVVMVMVMVSVSIRVGQYLLLGLLANEGEHFSGRA